MQISDIVITESYMETLKCHPKDRTKVYPLPKAVSYNGFYNAKTRLKKMGMDFCFTRIDDNQLSTVAIPLLKDKSVQQKINDLVLEANELRYQEYHKEQEAINKMNEILTL